MCNLYLPHSHVETLQSEVISLLEGSINSSNNFLELIANRINQNGQFLISRTAAKIILKAAA